MANTELKRRIAPKFDANGNIIGGAGGFVNPVTKDIIPNANPIPAPVAVEPQITPPQDNVVVAPGTVVENPPVTNTEGLQAPSDTIVEGDNEEIEDVTTPITLDVTPESKKDSTTKTSKTNVVAYNPPAIVTAKDFNTQLASGKMTQQDYDYFAKANPQLVQEAEGLRSNKADLLISNANQPTDLLSKAQEMAGSVYSMPAIMYDLENDPQYQQTYSNLQNVSSEINALDSQVTSQKRERDSIEQKVRAEAPAGATEGYIRANIAKRQRELKPSMDTSIDQYNSKLKTYNTLTATIDRISEVYDKKYNAQLQNHELQLAQNKEALTIYQGLVKEQQDLAMEDRKMQNDLQKITYQASLEVQKESKIDQIKNGDINSANPDLVYKAVSKQVDGILAKYDGLPFSRSGVEITQDIANQILKGIPVADAFSNLQKAIVSKPGYEEYIASKSKLDKLPKEVGGYVYYPDGKGGYIKGERTSAPISQTERDMALSNGYADIFGNPTVAELCLSKEPGTYGGQCGEFVNNTYAKLFGPNDSNANYPHFIDTVENKTKLAKAPGRNSQIPVVGGAVVQDFGVIDKDTKLNYGHVGIVVAVNGSKITVVDSNYAKDKKVKQRVIDVNDRSIKAFTKAPGVNQTAVDEQQGYVGTLLANVSSAYPTAPGQAAFKKSVNALKGKPEQLQAFLEQQYVEKMLPNAEAKKTHSSAVNAIAQSDTLLKTLEYYKSKGYNYDNSYAARGTRLKEFALAKLTGQSVSEETKRFQEVSAQVQQAASQTRNDLFGASLTVNEQGAATPFIVQTDDTIDEVIAKLKAQRQLATIAKEGLIYDAIGIPYDRMAKIAELSGLGIDNGTVSKAVDLATSSVKTPVKKKVSPDGKLVEITYSDGTTEIVPQ